MKAKVIALEEKCKEVERERAQSAKAQVDLKVSFDRAESLIKQQGHQIDEKDQTIAKKCEEIAEKDQKIAEKDQKIAEWEKRYNLAKYSRTLWAEDQTLLRFPDAKPFVEWLEPSADEPKLDIKGDDDESSQLQGFFNAFFFSRFLFLSLGLVGILHDPYSTNIAVIHMAKLYLFSYSAIF